MNVEGRHSLLGKFALVTGGSRGIGLSVARGLVLRGARVVFTGRDPVSGLKAMGELNAVANGGAGAVFLQADACDQAALRAVVLEIGKHCPRLDLLIHNAAFVCDVWRSTRDGVEAQFAANHLAVVLLTYELLPLVRAGAPARIVITASQMERNASTDFAPLATAARMEGYAPNQVYAQTKLANLLFCHSLAPQLLGSGVTVNALHPGVVRTGLLDALGRNASKPPSTPVTRLRSVVGTVLRATGLRRAGPDWALDTESGARTTLEVATSPALADSNGRYFVEGREATSSPASRDDDLAAELWALSSRCLGIPADWTQRIRPGRP